MLLGLWIRLFGDGERATHTLSLVFGLACIPLAYAAARALFRERTTALVCATLAALEPFLTYYAQETRMYELEAFLSLVAAYAYVEGVLRGRRIWIGVLIPTGLLARPSRTRRSITGITLPRRLITPGSQLGASGTGAMATMRRISPTLPTGRAYSDFSMRKTTSWVAVAEPASVSLRAVVVMAGVIGGPKRF